MARFDLTKGSKFDLTKENQGLNEIEVKLAWKGPDIDASTFLLGKDGVIVNDFDFVYFKSLNREGTFDEYQEKIKKDGYWSDPENMRNRATRRTWMEDVRPMSNDGALLGSIDDLGSEEDANVESDETINVNLEDVSSDIKEIVFVVTVYNEPNTPANELVTFGKVIQPYISITNVETEDELLRYTIDEKFDKETGVEVARLYRNEDDEWVFEAVGEGFDGGLQYFVELYT
jgi:tellurium resistance protein TerD